MIKRIIGKVIILDGLHVRSVGFNKYFPIGDPKFSIKYLQEWGADEISIIDISYKVNKPAISKTQLKSITEDINIPITIGGGIRSADCIDDFFKNGAEKIALQTMIFEYANNNLNEVINKYGKQSFVFSLDLLNVKNQLCIAHKDELITIKKFVMNQYLDYFGELHLNFINLDGMMLDFYRNIDNLKELLPECPIILNSGYKNMESLKNALSHSDISGVSIGNGLFFKEHSIELIKSQLAKAHQRIRPGYNNLYELFELDSMDRIQYSSKLPKPNCNYI